MPANPFFRRRRFITKKGLQFRYIGLVFGLAVLASLVTGWTVFATGWYFFGEKLASVYPQGRLLYVFKATNMALIRNLLLISPLIFIMGLFFSHRIAGPVYRIEKTLSEIAKGNLSMRIKLRGGDELVDLADMINSLTENLAGVMAADKDVLIKIDKDLEELKKLSSAQPCDCAKIAAITGSLQASSKALSASFNSWRVS